MNWFRTILDGVAMSMAFNSVVAVFWLLANVLDSIH